MWNFIKNYLVLYLLGGLVVSVLGWIVMGIAGIYMSWQDSRSEKRNLRKKEIELEIEKLKNKNNS